MAAGEKQQVPIKPGLGKDTLWLVKSGDRVLGPFNTAEVIRRLRAKELVVIDEIISPQARWRHIRDEPLFASVVDEIRTGLMTVRDDTEVGDSTGTPTITARGVNEDGTPIPVGQTTSVGAATNARFDSSFNVSRISDAEIVSETDDVEHIHVASAREIEKPTARGRSEKSVPKKNVHSSLAYTPPGKERKVDSAVIVTKTSRALWMLVAASVVVIGASLYFFKIAPVKRAGERSEEIARLRKEGDRAWSRAEFLRAQKLYQQINREPHTDLETDLRQAILQLRIEGDTLSAKRKLEDLVPRLTSSEARTRARIALAVASLQADEPLEAQNALMNLVREPDAGPIAYFNLGCAQAANGLRSEAIETLKKLDTHPSIGGPSRLLRALLSLKEGNTKGAVLAVESDLQNNQAAFQQELHAMGAVSDWLDGNKKRSNQRLRLALDTDPMQTEEFFFDPLLYLEAIRWKQLLPVVKDYTNKSKSNGAKALLALALIKSDRRTEAQQFLTESLSPRMNDADLQSVSAYGLMTQGRDDEARGALKFSQANQTEGVSSLAAILDARLLERASDRDAANKLWSEIAKRPNPPVIALVSLARAESQVATEKSLSGVERLRILYPNSVLVQKLHDEIVDASQPQPRVGAKAAP